MNFRGKGLYFYYFYTHVYRPYLIRFLEDAYAR